VGNERTEHETNARFEWGWPIALEKPERGLAQSVGDVVVT
jgi:hypothetical protein